MELDVLGTVELRVGGRPLELPGRALALAVALGVEPGRPVDRDTLIERVWDGELVERSTIDATLTRLRNRLRGVGAAPAALRSRAGIYRFQILPEAVDWQRFGRLHSEAGRARRNGDDPEAHARARAALDLWRGPPLAGLTGRWASGLRHRMQTRHQSVVELWAQTALATGVPDVVDELADHVHAYPANEHLAELLMRFLHAAGRPGEALVTYERLRDHLAEHGGVPRPSTEQTLRLVLGAESAGPHKRDLERPSPLPRLPRNTLPRDLLDFTGRSEEIEELVSSVLDHPPGATGVHVIHGLTGIGKSTLALRAAVLLGEHFPDGRLHIDLQGGGEPRPRKAPAEALRELLTMVDVHETDQPTSESGLAALWRDRTSGSRLLVVLDNAADVEQVRPLIPGGPDCTVLITSRWRLSELDGAHWLRLSWMRDDEAVALLTAVLGRHLPPNAVTEIAKYCGGHPLAMRLVSGQLRGRPSWTPETVLARLGDVRNGLGHIRSGDRSLESVFELSVQGLNPELRACFVRFALHPGEMFDIHAAAALVGESTQRAGVLLERLLDASMVEEPRPHHFTMHRLVSTFGKHEPSLSAAERHSALHRLFTYYLHACDQADRHYAPDRFRRPLPTEPGCDMPAFESLWNAYQWWDGEQQTVLDLLAWARAHGGFEAFEADIAHACAALLDASTRWEEAAAAHERAILVRGPRDPHGAAHALYDLGQAQWRLGRTEEAYASVAEAHRLWTLVGDSLGSSITLNELGTVLYLDGRYAESEGLHRRALEMARTADNRAGMADALNGLGNCAREMGDQDRAAVDLLEALEYFGQIGNLLGLARTKSDLAGAYRFLGYLEEAARLVREASEHFETAGDRRRAAAATLNLGELCRAMNDHEGSLRNSHAALVALREAGEVAGEIVALNQMGHALVCLGRAAEALSYLEEARHKATRKRSAYLYEVLLDLGHAHLALGSAEQAARLYARSLNAARETGTVRGEAQALLAAEWLSRGPRAQVAEKRDARALGQALPLLNPQEIEEICSELDSLHISRNL
ncbi:tetratricopeptide repeat protein [Nocardiopsis sp. NPDC049922]|uniref:AfsR/SARP family transcriptional regulator n=1 Tax=Nocardiopsis sp. NPDC049922 TaxID=3155157 RepID=UPI0033E317EB